MITEETKHTLSFTEDQLLVLHTFAKQAVEKQIERLWEANTIYAELEREQTIQDCTGDLTRALEIQQIVTEELILTRRTASGDRTR